MAGGSSIGKLNVMIGGSATDFDKVLSGVQKRVAGFGAKITSMPMAVSGMAGFMSGYVGDAIEKTVTVAARAATLFPGGENWAKKAGLLDFDKWEQSAERGIGLFSELNKMSQFHGISPQFAQTMKFMAGGDTETALKVIDKIAMAQAKLRAGDKSVAAGLSPFLDIRKFADGTVENGVNQVADALKNLNSQQSRIGLAGELAGAKGAGVMLEMLGGGSGKINKATKVLRDEDALVDDVGHAARVAKYLKQKDEAEQTGLDIHRGAIQLARKMNTQKYNEGEIGAREYVRIEKALMPNSPLAVFTGRGLFDPKGALTGKQFAIDYLKRTDPGFAAMFGGQAPDFKADAAAATQKAWEEDTQKLRDSIMSPEERYAREGIRIGRSGLNERDGIKALNNAFAGSFGVDAAISAARAQFAADQNTKGPGLAYQGSQEAFAAIDAMANKKEDPDTATLVQLAKLELDKQKEAITQREEIVGQLRRLNDGGVVVIPP